MTKTCTNCKVEKDISEFRKNQSWCKACNKEYSKIWYEANKPEILRKQKEHYEANKPEILRKQKEHYEANKDKIAKRQKVWNEVNKEKVAKDKKRWAETNKDKIAKRQKIWHSTHKKERREHYSANRDEINKKHRKYHKNRMKTDPLYKCKCNLRSLVTGSFKRAGFKKNKHTEEILGCSPDELRKHMESLFTKGMTWENHGHGGWHYDHIIPMSTAKTIEEATKLCHYTNLQPLWATSEIAAKYGEVNYIGNLNKSDKILPSLTK